MPTTDPYYRAPSPQKAADAGPRPSAAARQIQPPTLLAVLTGLGCECCSGLEPLDSKEVQEQHMGNAHTVESIRATDCEDGSARMFGPRALEAGGAVPAEWGGPGLYSVVLRRLEGDKLGLDVDYQPQRQSLPIVCITGGMAERWNQENPSCPLAQGDCIVEVNGLSRDPVAMVKMCQGSSELRMTLLKGTGGPAPCSPRPPPKRATGWLACVACAKAASVCTLDG